MPPPPWQQPASYPPPPTQYPHSGPQASYPPQAGPPSGPQYGQPQQPPQAIPQYGQQQYGRQWQPPPQPFPPPHAPKPKLKPSMWWVGGAWAIALACVATGVVLFVIGLVSGIGGAAPSRTFVSGETVTVRLDPADRPVLYYSGPASPYTCKSLDAAKLDRSGGEQSVTVNGLVWHRLAAVNVPSAGDYRLLCTTQEEVSARFGIGRTPAASGTGALLALSGAGLAIGLAATIFVLVRRSAARKRLLPSRM